MARKRRRSRSGGKGKGGGGGGALGSLRGGFRSVARGAAGVGKPTSSPRKSGLVMNVVLVLAVAAAAFFLLRRFGILR
jgi:hypothetical protein